MVFRACMTFGEPVLTTMLGVMGVTHAGMSVRQPSTSTQHTRQLPAIFSLGW